MEEPWSINQTGKKGKYNKCIHKYLSILDFLVFITTKIILRLGRFTRDGSLFENLIPFWTSENNQ